MKQKTAEVTIQALEKIICREGIIDEVVCDNGPAFIHQRFTKFMETYGIKLRHTTLLWPQANGEVERQNRNVLRRLRIAQGIKQNWKRDLLVYLSAYRSTPHSTTGLAPGNVFRGRNYKTKLPELTQSSKIADEEMRDTDRYKKDKYKQYADKKRGARESDIQLGDKVLIKQRKDNKLSTPFSPVEHKVIWKNGNSVAVQSPEGKVIGRNSSNFKPVKERDLSKFGMEEAAAGNEDKNDEIISDMTDERDTRTGTNYPTETLPKTQRQAPAKYKDFVLGLILESRILNRS